MNYFDQGWTSCSCFVKFPDKYSNAITGFKLIPSSITFIILTVPHNLEFNKSIFTAVRNEAL